MAPAAHPSSHSPNSDQPQWARASDLLSWAPWVVRSTGRLKSKHPEMSSIKIFFAISLNLQSAYFPLVFILGKHNAFSYSRLQQPPEPKDDFFPQDTHASNSLPKILFNLLYSGNQVSKFRIKFQVILNHINDKHWVSVSPKETWAVEQMSGGCPPIKSLGTSHSWTWEPE